MNKYKLLFDYLKTKVGPDPARMIIYDVYCDDTKDMFIYYSPWEKLVQIYKTWGIRRHGTVCDERYIYVNWRKPDSWKNNKEYYDAFYDITQLDHRYCLN